MGGQKKGQYFAVKVAELSKWIKPDKKRSRMKKKMKAVFIGIKVIVIQRTQEQQLIRL